MKNLAINQLRRYYHLIAISTSENVLSKAFMKFWKIKEKNSFEYNNNTLITKYIILSDNIYYRGEVDYSYNKDNNPPFAFDIISIVDNKTNFQILCFPFKRLAKDIIISLVENNNLLVKSDFIKVNMNQLIHANDIQTDFIYKNSYFFFAGVYLTVSGDSYLTTVKLEGDKPLDSDLYKAYFKTKIKNNECKLEKCIIKCKSSTKINNEEYNTISTVHIDKFGNYKLYLNSTGSNILTIPALFGFLRQLKGLISTSNNPVNHINSNEL
jgi:hypothetical protein